MMQVNHRTLVLAVLSAVTILTSPSALSLMADEKSATVTLPDDPQEAWAAVDAAVQKAYQAQRDPSKAQDVGKAAGEAHAKAAAFLAKFPKDTHAPEARQGAARALMIIAFAGDEATDKPFQAFVDAQLADPQVPDEDKFQLSVGQAQMRVIKEGNFNPFSGKQPTPELLYRLDQAMTNALVEGAQKYPRSTTLYPQLLNKARQADGDEARQLAQLIVEGQHAPADLKQAAQEIVAGKQPYEIGKPLDIKFTAVDGRKVDLSKLKGKVVLLDFWATWCGPCVAEMPHIKATYDKYHDQGFEIVGISFDKDKQSLVKFVAEQKMPWPQYFDGQGWSNAYGAKYGIDSIPRMWLIDKNGNLADLNARAGLEQKVEKLLAAKPLQ